MTPTSSDIESFAENIIAMLRSQGYEPTSHDEKQIRIQLMGALENGDFLKEFERVGGALGAAQNYLETGDIFHVKDDAKLVKDIGLTEADVAPISLILRVLWVFAVFMNIGLFAIAPIAFGVFTTEAISIFYSFAYLVYASVVIVPLILLHLDKTIFTTFLKDRKKARIAIGMVPLVIGIIDSVLGLMALIIGQLAYNIALFNEHLRFIIFFVVSSIIMLYSWPFTRKQLENVSRSKSILTSHQHIMKFTLLSLTYLMLPALLTDPLYLLFALLGRASISAGLLLPFGAFFWGHIILSFIFIYYLFIAKEYFKYKQVVQFRFSIVNIIPVVFLFLRLFLIKRKGVAVDQKIFYVIYLFLILTFPWTVFRKVKRSIVKEMGISEKSIALRGKVMVAKQKASTKYRSVRNSFVSKISIKKQTERELPTLIAVLYAKTKDISKKISIRFRSKRRIWGKEFRRKFTIFPLGNNPASIDSLIFWVLTLSVFIVVQALRYEFLHPKIEELEYLDYYATPGAILVSFTYGLDFVISFFYLWLFLEITLAIILIRNSAMAPKGIGLGGLLAEMLNRAIYGWIFLKVLDDIEYWDLLSTYQIEVVKGIGYFIIFLHVLRWLLNLGRTDALGTVEFALIQILTIVMFLFTWSLWGQYLLPRLLKLLF